MKETTYRSLTYGMAFALLMAWFVVIWIITP